MPHLIDPCPFCGSSNVSLRVVSLGMVVNCGQCGTDGPFKSRRYKDHELSTTENEIAAVNAWNNRAMQGCGACGDGCVQRGSCRLASESPSI